MVGFEEGEDLEEEEPEEHKELIDSEVVYFIPVQIEDVHAGFKPHFLTFFPLTLQLRKQLRDLLSCVLLVHSFVGVPKHYK